MFHKFLRWARITKSGANGQQFATQQVSYMGKAADSLMIFPYGVHANVPPDNLALMMSINGAPDNRASIAWDAKVRPILESSEVSLYHPPTGSLIKWDSSGDLTINNGTTTIAVVDDSVTIDNGSGNIELSGNTLTLNCNVIINGSLSGNSGASFTGSVTNNGKNIGDTHQHSQGNDSNGDTQQNITGVL